MIHGSRSSPDVTTGALTTHEYSDWGFSSATCQVPQGRVFLERQVTHTHTHTHTQAPQGSELRTLVNTLASQQKLTRARERQRDRDATRTCKTSKMVAVKQRGAATRPGSLPPRWAMLWRVVITYLGDHDRMKSVDPRNPSEEGDGFA